MSTFLGGMSIFAFTVSKPVNQPLIYAVGVQIVFILKFTEWLKFMSRLQATALPKSEHDRIVE